jgi:tetratricopeptide (TPR) repeat protein
LLAASRYGRAESQSNSKFKSLTVEALFHSSVACLALAGGDEILPEARIKEAYALIHEAIKLAPNLTEAWFQAAKYKALLGNSEKAIEILEVVIARDSRYAAKALADDALSRIGPELDALIRRLQHARMSESEIALREAEEMLERSERFPFWDEEEGGHFHQLAKTNLAQAWAAHVTGTFLGFLEAIELARRVRDDATKSVQVRRREEGKQQAEEKRRREAEELERRLLRGKTFAWAGLAVGIPGFFFPLISPLALYFGIVALQNLPPRTSYVDNDRDRAGWAIGLGVFGCLILIVFLISLTGKLLG